MSGMAYMNHDFEKQVGFVAGSQICLGACFWQALTASFLRAKMELDKARLTQLAFVNYVCNAGLQLARQPARPVHWQFSACSRRILAEDSAFSPRASCLVLTYARLVRRGNAIGRAGLGILSFADGSA